jgi:hypothetical protein
MKLLERMTHYTNASDAEIMEKEKLYDALEEKLGGFPPKTRYRPLYSAEKNPAFIWERIWDSWEAIYEAYSRELEDPEWAKINQTEPDFGSYRRELFYLLE